MNEEEIARRFFKRPTDACRQFSHRFAPGPMIGELSTDEESASLGLASYQPVQMAHQAAVAGSIPEKSVPEFSSHGCRTEEATESDSHMSI